jgi:hypothetical protein
MHFHNCNPYWHRLTHSAMSIMSVLTWLPLTITITDRLRSLQFSLIAAVNAWSCVTPMRRSWQ